MFAQLSNPAFVASVASLRFNFLPDMQRGAARYHRNDATNATDATRNGNGVKV
ncbi:MAG: hypothetical protein HYR88_03690 [Verrucomicrobia bacterium]|nr:hypothetical protein [Verrucomicrobiota bacterium]